MARINLADLQQQATEKYQPYIIEGVDGGDVTLLNAVRLPKESRDKLRALQGDEAEPLQEILRVLAESDADAERLFGAVGDDNAVYAEILEDYRQATQQGEASPSQS